MPKKGSTQKRLSDDEHKALLDMLKDGSTKHDLSDKFGVSVRSVERFAGEAGLTAVMTENTKKARALSKKTGSTDQSVGRPAFKTAGKVREKTEREITNLALENVETALDIGNHILREYQETADAYGYGVKEFLKIAVGFWQANHNMIEEKDAEIELCHIAIARLKSAVDPALQELGRKKKIEKIVYLQMLKTGEVQDNLLNEFLNGK